MIDFTPHKPVFVLGMRRSGTSMLCQLINRCEGVNILFEPHDIWFALTHRHIDRFTDNESVVCAEKVLKQKLCTDQITGAKFALNPGREAFGWRYLSLIFPQARFIFIRRNWTDTFNSYTKLDEDSVYGVAHEEIHSYFWSSIYSSFVTHMVKSKSRSLCEWVEYEDIIKTKGESLSPVWDLLGVKAPLGVANCIHRPEQQRGLQ